jgi:transposase
MAWTTEGGSVENIGPNRRRLRMHYIGMDVHSKVTMYCLLDESGKRVREREVRGDLGALVAAVGEVRKAYGALKVCYEASSGCGWLHDELVKLGCQVQVGHPGKLRLIFRSKRKNDRVDAQKLALLLFLDQVPLAYVPPAERRAWRSLIEYRHRLVERRAATKVRLRALVREHGLRGPRTLWTRQGLTWLREQAWSAEATLQRNLLLEELRSAGVLIREVEKALAARADREPGVGLLRTIPGVGIRTAEAVVVYIDDPHRFRRNKSVGCYFGLVPCEDTSVKARFGHITKEGPTTVRKLLVEATWQAIRRDAGLKAYFERVGHGDADRRKIALVATAHHLVRAMHAMLRTGEVWRSAAA